MSVGSGMNWFTLWWYRSWTFEFC